MNCVYLKQLSDQIKITSDYLNSLISQLNAGLQAGACPVLNRSAHIPPPAAPVPPPTSHNMLHKLRSHDQEGIDQSIVDEIRRLNKERILNRQLQMEPTATPVPVATGYNLSPEYKIKEWIDDTVYQSVRDYQLESLGVQYGDQSTFNNLIVQPQKDNIQKREDEFKRSLKKIKVNRQHHMESMRQRLNEYQPPLNGIEYVRSCMSKAPGGSNKYCNIFQDIDNPEVKTDKPEQLTRVQKMINRKKKRKELMDNHLNINRRRNIIKKYKEGLKNKLMHATLNTESVQLPSVKALLASANNKDSPLTAQASKNPISFFSDQDKLMDRRINEYKKREEKQYQ